MTARLDPFAAAQAPMKSWFSASLDINSAMDPGLGELVEIRASQINGCASCINLHVTEALAKGESEQRLHLIAAWREAPCFSERERAALGWTEALTRLSEGHGTNVAYDELAAHFTQEEQVKLTLMINVINGWNRLCVGFGIWSDPDRVRESIRAAAA
ncbi:MAG TPA: carboxymuconolactone decarboxylase family protein [Sphingomicrobium sp.]|nr:carboxymuconolactone decarboxylase family protein [Sphingomicrobium sp.]